MRLTRLAAGFSAAPSQFFSLWEDTQQPLSLPGHAWPWEALQAPRAQGSQLLTKQTCTSDEAQHEIPFTGPWAMSDRADDILPHLFLNNKRLFGLEKAWLFTGNNTADDSSWQTWWWLGYTTKKTPYCSPKHNTGQNFNPSLHSGWAAFASLTLLLPRALQTCPWDLRDLMFLFNHSPNPLPYPNKRTSINRLSPGCWQLLIAITLTGAVRVSKAEFSSVLHPEMRPAW